MKDENVFIYGLLFVFGAGLMIVNGVWLQLWVGTFKMMVISGFMLGMLTIMATQLQLDLYRSLKQIEVELEKIHIRTDAQQMTISHLYAERGHRRHGRR